MKFLNQFFESRMLSMVEWRVCCKEKLSDKLIKFLLSVGVVDTTYLSIVLCVFVGCVAFSEAETNDVDGFGTVDVEHAAACSPSTSIISCSSSSASA